MEIALSCVRRPVAWAVLSTWVWAGVPATAAAENLRLVTGELPPYATQERPDDGIALDIVRKAFANVGSTVSYTFKPWTRSQQYDGSRYTQT